MTVEINNNSQIQSCFIYFTIPLYLLMCYDPFSIFMFGDMKA